MFVFFCKKKALFFIFKYGIMYETKVGIWSDKGLCAWELLPVHWQAEGELRDWKFWVSWELGFPQLLELQWPAY